MLAEFLVLVVALVATVLIYLITYARKHYGELEALGIPVVKPHFFLGSNPNYYKIYNHELDLENFKKYGEVYGTYEGRVPTVNICDPDIVRQITIKDFDHFRNHNFHDFMGIFDERVVGQMMDFLDDDAWKTVRSLMSPTFTTSKLKRMSSIMREVSEEFVEQTKTDLKKTDNGVLEGISIYDELFNALTDLVARVTLNIKIDNPKDPNNDFAKALRQLFILTSPGFFTPYARSFQFLKKFFPAPTAGDINFFSYVYRKVMDDRQKSGQRHDDFIDFLVEFRERTKTDPEMKKLGITEDTVIANAVEFYVAGQDAMATVISVLCYNLTKNPEIERKLYNEIDAYTEKYKGKVDRDSFGDLPYLNACLSEVLRIHSGFLKPDRLCNKDWEYKGLKIKKGMTVVFPLWAYHRNPKYFPDPEKFDPERFMPYNKDKLEPMSYFAFGHGPRMCIGMRFAFECLTMASVHIFQNFQFKARADTEITYIPGFVWAAMLGPLKFDLLARNKAT